MGSEPCVYEISSSSDDDEDGILLVKASGLPVSHKRNKMSLNSDEDNDVVVIEKLFCPEARTMGKSSALNSIPLLSGTKKIPTRKSTDDDCCILDHDPEKNVLALDSHSNDTDDLVVTGESGPVACRDYPHARHLCAKFPFQSTAHESFCEQCHCYVCDTLAPCFFWFLGKESSDHCHAYDKDENWKILRNRLKPGSLPLPAAVSHPLSSRHGIPRIHSSVSSSQQMFPGTGIASRGLSSSTDNLYPDPSLIFGLSSNFLCTSDTSSLPIYLRPYAPPSTNVARGIGAYSDSMVFSAMVPVTVDSSTARTRSLNHAAPTNRARVIKPCSSNVTNQNRWATVPSGVERQDLNQSGPFLPNTVDGSGLSRTAASQSCIRHVTVEKNTPIRLNRQVISQPQTHTMSRVHSRTSELTATVSRDSSERLGQLGNRGPSQSVPTMFEDLIFGPRALQPLLHMLQDDIVLGGSCQWEHENVSQTSESTALSGVVPSQMSASQTACSTNLHSNVFNSGVERGVETHRRANSGQNVQISTMINIPGANQVEIEDSQQEILVQQIPTGQEVDVSLTLDDILAQLDCGDLWEELDLTRYQ